MHQPQDTLRYLRHSLLLRHSPLLWQASALLGLVCVVSQWQHLGVWGLPLLLVPLLAWGFNGWSDARLKSHAGFNPVPWIAVLVFLNAVLWGMAARYGGLCLTLALAFTGMAGIALYAQFRLVLLAWLPVALLPMVVAGPIGWATLLELHLPLMVLILVGGWQGHRMALRNMERSLENRHLHQLLSRHRDQLEQQVERRTEELELTNDQLNAEIELRKAVNQSLLKSEEQMNLAMAASGLGFWDWDLNKHRVYHSDLKRFFGQDTEEENYFDLSERIESADLQQVRRALARHLSGKSDVYHARYRIHHKDDAKLVWIEDSGKVIQRSADGRALRMIGTRRDISDMMRQEEELKLSASLFNNSPDGVFVLDSEQCFRTCNRVFSQIFGLQKSQLLGLPLFRVIRSEQGPRIVKGITNNGRWQGDIVTLRSGHERFPMSLTLTAIRSDDNRVSHYLGICRDLTEQKRSRMALDYLSQHDALTGLFNRNYFLQLIKQFEQHDPLLPNQYAVAVFNLDNFRVINDRLGQDVGDQLLRDVAVRLNNLNDPVRQVARLGADEFALLIDFEGNQVALSESLSLALEEISRPSLIGEHELVITASCGVCILHQDNRLLILNQANAALLSAREQGGNGYVLYRQSLASRPGLRDTLLEDLRSAVSKNQLSIHYQPKLNLVSNSIDSVEALVRWQHPSQGIIEPEDFIPLAEESNLLIDIGEQVLHQACRDIVVWSRLGLGINRVSVNLSLSQFYQADFIERLQQHLQSSGCSAKQLELEVTESMLMEDLARAQDTLNRLRELGISRALDDYGTGFSSLNHLKQLPLDVIKIDRSFVRESRQGESNPVIEAIVAMAASLKMKVVAEGVENQQQLDYLKSLGCGHAQGYMVSRPLAAEELVALLKHTNLQVFPANTQSLH